MFVRIIGFELGDIPGEGMLLSYLHFHREYQLEHGMMIQQTRATWIIVCSFHSCELASFILVNSGGELYMKLCLLYNMLHNDCD